VTKEWPAARILIVEDNEPTRRMMARCLSAHALSEAGDGETALAHLAAQPVDLVLLDIGLPGIDGFQVLERIKSTPATAQTAVIVVTAHGQTDEIVKGFQQQADDYLIKPFRPEELTARVSAALRLKHALDELSRINADLEVEVQARTRQLLAQQQFALLGRNSAQIAHNLNSPLAALLGYLELALAKPPEQREELLGRCRTVAAEMQGAISRLLIGVRSGQAADTPEPQDLNALVREQAQFWHVNSQFRYRTRVSLELADGLPPVVAARNDIVQVLSNLIDNALYALRDRPDATLVLRTACAAGLLRVTVEDNGTGIAPEHLGRLFDPTFTTKPMGEGTGLGLASCYELATAYNGRLEIASTLGQGTRATLVLPT